MTCACTDTSSAETGSSQTISLGLRRERARDAEALALAAGELVRVLDHLVGAQADLVEQRRDPLVDLALPARDSKLRIGSATMSPARMRGLSDDVRVLEDHLQLAPERAHLRAR